MQISFDKAKQLKGVQIEYYLKFRAKIIDTGNGNKVVAKIVDHYIKHGSDEIPKLKPNVFFGNVDIDQQ